MSVCTLEQFFFYTYEREGGKKTRKKIVAMLTQEEKKKKEKRERERPHMFFPRKNVFRGMTFLVFLFLNSFFVLIPMTFPVLGVKFDTTIAFAFLVCFSEISRRISHICM